MHLLQPLLACSLGLIRMSVLAGVHASDDGADVACPVSLIEWFLNFYKESQKGLVQPLEGICRAGEVLFVPRGWWHMALNLEVGLGAAALVQSDVAGALLLLLFCLPTMLCTVAHDQTGRVSTPL
jgi:hypothetical protein